MALLARRQIDVAPVTHGLSLSFEQAKRLRNHPQFIPLVGQVT